MLHLLAIVVVMGGIAVGLLSVLSALYRLVTIQKPHSARVVAATAILPLTGPSPRLHELVAALGRQTLLPRRLIVSVESEADPAFARAVSIAPSAKFPIEIVVAGEAQHQGQKCRNQQAALARIDASDEAIVLLDGDIIPQDWWLSALVSPLATDFADVVTGLRWQRPVAARLGAHLVAVIDRALIILPRFDNARMVWGGSVGISVSAARRMDLNGCLERTLSDDLTIGSRASDGGLRLLTRGALLVPSPGDAKLVPAWRFARRQYQICKIYRPRLWLLAAFSIGLRLAAWIAALSMLGQGPLFAWAILALAGLGILKQALVGEIARRVGLPDPFGVRVVQLMLGLLQPLVDLFHLAVVLPAAWTRRVDWSHVTYDVAGPDAIRVKERRPLNAA